MTNGDDDGDQRAKLRDASLADPEETAPDRRETPKQKSGRERTILAVKHELQRAQS